MIIGARPALAALLLAGLVAAPGGNARADVVRASGSVRGDVGRLTLAWPSPVEFEARSAGGRHVLRFARPVEADFAAAVAPLSRFLGPPEISDGGRGLAFPLKPGIVALTFADQSRVVIDLFDGFPPAVVAAQEGPPSAATGPLGGIRPPVAAPNRAAKTKPAHRRPADESAGSPSAPSLRFDWAEPVAAAAFRRGDALWLVFDKPSTADIAALRAAGGEALRAIDQRPHPRATVLRLELGGEAGIRRDGLAWILDLGQEAAKPALSVEPAPREDPDGVALVLPVAEPGVPVVVTDPGVGDTLVVVPVVPPGHGLARDRSYPELRLLASLQGLVVRPLVDDLQVRPGREAVELARPGGLAVTAPDPSTRARAQLRASAGGERMLQVGEWATRPIEAYTSTRRVLEAVLASAESLPEREHAWLRLANLDLAYGLAAEALGALERAREARPAMAEEPRFALMRGAASLLLGRLAEAQRDLGHPGLAQHPEAAAWRTALSVVQGESGESGERLAEQAAIVAGYPRVLRRVVLPALAEAAVDAGEPALAESLLALLSAEAEGPAEAAAAAFLDGRRLAANGDTPGALARWREVEAGLDPERQSQVRAEYARVEVELKDKRMQPAEAIDALEALSFAWRGDALELAILRRLAELRLAGNDFAGALRTFRRTATSFPAAMQTDDIPAKMTQAFAALFVGEGAETLSPLQAIALYDEFRELTPADARGDRVIEAVAERMVDLDLLGRATSLLESQVRFRLTGAPRAAAGARLASLYLLDDKAQAALKALEATAEPDLPGVLARDRQAIAARALARLGREKEALARLEGMDTADAAAVRADAYWRLADWPQAARSLQTVLAAGAGAAPERADRVLHLAVALALAGDEAGLRRLADAEGASMAQSRWKDVFPLIAANTMPAADAGPIDRFRAYLAGGAHAAANQRGGSGAEPI